MNILVVGAGWFGCMVARELQSMGLGFDMIDKQNSFFAGSSANNQNRLHLGFHYCRSFGTREECRKGYAAFMERFPELTEDVRSYYLVANKSLVDFKTYTAIFDNEGTQYETKTLQDLRDDGLELDSSFVNGSSVIVVKERWINHEKAKARFTSKFADRMIHFDPSQLSISGDCNHVSYGTKQYDLVFDATYGHLMRSPSSEYEVCLTLVYRKRAPVEGTPPVTLTVVDGAFYSIYLYRPGEQLYTVTHVDLTPMFSSECIRSVDEFINQTSVSDVTRRKESIEQSVCSSILNFKEAFEYHSYFVSVKTKYTDSGFADRSTRVDKRGRVVSVCGGKITGALGLGPVVSQSVRECGAGGACS